MPTIGLVLMAGDASGLGYGSGTMSFSVEVPVNGEPATVGNGFHIAFAAENCAMVDSFHGTALELGGTSDGEPGLRPRYDPNYYGEFPGKLGTDNPLHIGG